MVSAEKNEPFFSGNIGRMGKEVRRRKAPVDPTPVFPLSWTHASSMTLRDDSLSLPLKKQQPNVGPQTPSLLTLLNQLVHQIWLLVLKRWKHIKVLVVIIICLVIWPLKIRWFGSRGSLQGGLIGRLIDNFLRTLHFRNTLHKRNSRLASFGYHLPPLMDPDINQRGIPVITQSYLAETLIKSAKRRNAQKAAEQQASQWSTQSHETQFGIPLRILQPNVGDWFRPWKDTGGMEVLQFDESEMHLMVRNHFPGLFRFFDDSEQPVNDRISLWALCALYQYGGHFVSNRINDMKQFQQSVVLPTDLGITKGQVRDNQVSVVVLSRKKSNEMNDGIVYLAATPRNRQLKCALLQLEQQINATRTQSKDTTADIMHVIGTAMGADIINTPSVWYSRVCATDSTKHVGCCEFGSIQKLPLEASATDGERRPPLVLVKILMDEHDDATEKASNQSVKEPRVLVEVTEKAGTSAPKTGPKQSILHLLENSKCEAGWLCNRCLKTPWYGSFQSCSAVCRSCYENILCKQPDDPPKKEVVVDVRVHEQRPLGAGDKLIPRIIHQTWYDEISPARYPHFVRFQNSWKNTGWEYRFYMDDDVREYISRNFPSRFLDAFDALIPGAFKADLFRLLVLFREGGIYVDVDVKLDANLDSFITPAMSFFVPRDSVAEPGEYCLWNGIIGAAPGHPLLAASLERLITAVLNRADYYDMEREVCRKSATGRASEIWKVRALPVVLLTGPCALGLAVNAALGSSSLVSKIDTGWLLPNRTVIGKSDMFGDMIVLLSDKYDMGEMRFTDLDRNLLFASTNQNLMPSGAAKFFADQDPLVAATKEKPHYSSTVRKSGDVFGARAVYADDQVTNEILKFQISYTRSNEGGGQD